MIAVPQRNVLKGAKSSEKTMSVTFQISPLRMMNGAITNALSRFWLCRPSQLRCALLWGRPNELVNEVECASIDDSHTSLDDDGVH